jgi:hypothetical protein
VIEHNVAVATRAQRRVERDETTAPAWVDAPLYARVERLVPRLARTMIDTFVAEIPLYAMLPREQLEGEILAITTANLRLFFSTLREGRPLAVEELNEIRMSAARRAEERVPLEAVLTAYHVGGRIGWQALVDGAGPDDTGALIAAGTPVLRYVQQVTAAVSAAYLEEQQTIFGEERDARRSLASALLAGEPAESLAARLGTPVAASYLVVALRMDRHEDETDQGVGGAVAARRKVRRVQGVLDEMAGEPVLSLLEPTGGLLLLPGGPQPPADPADLLSGLVDSLIEASGATVLAGAAVAGTAADVPRAAVQAQDVLRLAVRLGRPAGGYLLRDVLLEYQLTRPSDAVAELMRLLDPIDRNPDLPHTLEVYLDNDLDRRRAAAALHVHPNTLDYRLRRIVELTGLDPSTAHGLQLLGAAVAARKLSASAAT